MLINGRALAVACIVLGVSLCVVIIEPRPTIGDNLGVFAMQNRTLILFVRQ